MQPRHRPARSRVQGSQKDTPIQLSDIEMKLLVVSPIETDHTVLREILSPTWVLSRATGMRSALLHLHKTTERVPLILCERDLSPNSWRELLDHIVQMVDPPLLIVASRFADERLWAEALNVGAYDVLAKPFERDEVRRVLTSAWVRCARALSKGASSTIPVQREANAC